MTPEGRTLIKDFVKEKTNESHTHSRLIARMLEAKFEIDEGNTQNALNLLLELIIRQSDVYEICSLDGLTKLLNTTHQVRLDTGPFTVRDLIKENS